MAYSTVTDIMRVSEQRFVALLRPPRFKPAEKNVAAELHTYT